MTKEELFLKTAFCFMACDGRIDPQEIPVMKEHIKKYDLGFSDDTNTIDSYIKAINKNSASFLKDYISEVKDSSLSNEDMLNLVKIAIDIIESDDVIEFSEIAFFKKFREVLPISDEAILEKLPNKEDYLLPDSNNEYDFSTNLSFNICDYNFSSNWLHRL